MLVGVLALQGDFEAHAKALREVGAEAREVRTSGQLEGIDAAGARLANFVKKAAQATLVGDVFDDAATGQGLLNFFLRGINSGAVSNQVRDVANAEVIFLIGANPTDGHPVFASQMKRRLREGDDVSGFTVLEVEPENDEATLGLRGLGECGNPGLGAAIANAVCDALGGGTTITALPITPERVAAVAART